MREFHCRLHPCTYLSLNHQMDHAYKNEYNYMYNLKEKNQHPCLYAAPSSIVRMPWVLSSPSLAATPSHSGLFRANFSPKCRATYLYDLTDRDYSGFFLWLVQPIFKHSPLSLLCMWSLVILFLGRGIMRFFVAFSPL